MLVFSFFFNGRAVHQITNGHKIKTGPTDVLEIVCLHRAHYSGFPKNNNQNQYSASASYTSALVSALPKRMQQQRSCSNW